MKTNVRAFAFAYDVFFLAGCLILTGGWGSAAGAAGAVAAAAVPEADVNHRITRADALADVQQFFSTLQRVHPDLLARVVGPGHYLKLKGRTTDEIAGKAGKDGTIAIRDLAYVLYYAAAFFGDGHTHVQWPFQQSVLDAGGQQFPPPFLMTLAAGKRFPPFLLRYEDGGFTVEGSDDASTEGREVLAVDGKPIREFLRPILDRCSGETLKFKAATFTADPLLEFFSYSFTDLYGSAASIKLRLRDARGKVRERTVRTADSAGFLKLARGRVGMLKLRQRGTTVFFYDSGRIAHLVYPLLVLTEDEKRKIDAIFRQIKARGSRELIVDLRHNGGGNSAMGDFLFSYLYDGKFTMFSKGRVKLSRDVMPSVAGNYGIPETAEVDGLIATGTFRDQSHPKPKAFFTGRTFLLVDNVTYSSASDFAALFRDYRAGTIVGSETGGLPISFGDPYSFRLAHSGIECSVSVKQFYPPKPKPGDDEHGVLPDIPANRESLRSYRSEEDPVLALTIHHIKKTRSHRVPRRLD